MPVIPYSAPGRGVHSLIRRFDLGALRFNTSTAPGGVERWGRIGPEGWYVPPRRRAVTDKPQSHGAWSGRPLFSPRVFPVRGSFIAADNSTLQLALAELAALCASEEDFELVTYEDVTKRLMVHSTESEPVIEEASEVIGRFELELRALDPWKYGPEQSVTIALASGPGGGLAIPAAVPFVLGEGVSGNVAVVTNPGPAPAYPVIEVTGPVSNPRWTNESTGEYLELRTTLLAADTMVVDFAKQTALIGAASRASTKPVGAKWWSIPPETSVNVRYTATAVTSSVSTVRVSGLYP